jgi:hypothetical protein
MKAMKLITILLLLYIAVVVAFESWLGYAQPTGQTSLVISTTGADGTSNDRVLSTLRNNGQLYVAANHWPRAWYKQALAHPQVQITLAGEKKDYLAIPVATEEHERVNRENKHGLAFRILTGFPPRYFIRLEPR